MIFFNDVLLSLLCCLHLFLLVRKLYLRTVQCKDLPNSLSFILWICASFPSPTASWSYPASHQLNSHHGGSSDMGKQFPTFGYFMIILCQPLAHQPLGGQLSWWGGGCSEIGKQFPTSFTASWSYPTSHQFTSHQEGGLQDTYLTWGCNSLPLQRWPPPPHIDTSFA